MLEIGETNRLGYGLAQKQQRAHEDRYQIKTIGNYRYFAVFDGHSGAFKMNSYHVADVCTNLLHIQLAMKLYNADKNNIINIIKESFVEFDRLMYNEGKLWGCTCTMILIDDYNKLIYQINLGDSRSLIFVDNEIIAATTDHKPLNYIESERILTAGGYITTDDRIDGILNISRGFGDFYLKQKNNRYDPINGKVSAVPDIRMIDYSPYNVPIYIILTSDGIYESPNINNGSLVQLFYDISDNINLQEQNPLDKIAFFMIDATFSKTTDDMTIIIVKV